MWSSLSLVESGLASLFSEPPMIEAAPRAVEVAFEPSHHLFILSTDLLNVHDMSYTVPGTEDLAVNKEIKLP